MRNSLRSLLGIVTVVLLIGGPLAFAVHQQAQTRNFRVVREGVLYRSGQMTVEGLKRAVHDYGIRTVITLRETFDGPSGGIDRDEEAFCQRQEIKYVRIPPRSWYLQNGTVPADVSVRAFVDTLSDESNHPVLIHCFAGVHRTGAYCAIFRMESDGWSNERAIAEVMACGYDNLLWEFDILGYLENYRRGRVSE